jgi:hypothetical protein
MGNNSRAVNFASIIRHLGYIFNIPDFQISSDNQEKQTYRFSMKLENGKNAIFKIETIYNDVTGPEWKVYKDGVPEDVNFSSGSRAWSPEKLEMQIRNLYGEGTNGVPKTVKGNLNGRYRKRLSLIPGR